MTDQRNNQAKGRDDKPEKYIVGIDLGTTHCVVTFCNLNSIRGSSTSHLHSTPKIELFEIEQLIGPGVIGAKPFLPSFRYHPAVGEIKPSDCVLPWQASKEAQPLAGDIADAIVGEWARDLNSKVDGRGVVSAKSWLSHPSVECQAPILPWSAAEGVAKVSPVVASASYLSHIRLAWDYRFAQSPLAEQEVIITIPASFDEAARSLTLTAARLAGLDRLLLLEEPQAVFYDWLYRQGDTAAQKLANTRLILVCDLGGGTTDLSLVSVAIDGSEIELKRVAVGDHLMLGGDNVDLAIAHQAELQVTQGTKKLTASALSQLIQQSRQAKEQLLSAKPTDNATITILGSGSKLIGGMRKTQVNKSDVHTLVVEGFFPLTAFDDEPGQRRAGIVEFGLNYAADPAVSKHISSFLKRHQSACRLAVDNPADPSTEGAVFPDALLLNGGFFNSPLIVDRVKELFAHWTAQPITVLKNDRPEQAVAYGATAYGLARRGLQTKIEGGSARSYFLMVDSLVAGERKALCVLPKGSAEDDKISLTGKQFSLKLGQPVVFNLISTVADNDYQLGQLIDVNEHDFMILPPLMTVLANDEGSKKERVVELVATMTSVGALQMQCVSLDRANVWDLEFQVRSPLAGDPQQGPEVLAETALPKKFPEAVEKIEEVYGKSVKDNDKNSVKNLRSTLEKLVGKKADWDTALLRAFAIEIAKGTKRRRRSSSHERLWNNLMGYCLRPGFGHPLDEWQVTTLWEIYQQGVQFANESQSWAEWWTMWRRVAGGLPEQAQQKIYHDIGKYINPGTARIQNIAQELKSRSYEDIVRLAAVLEHLPVESKIEVGGWLVKRLEKPNEVEASWWALGRIGSRVPFHGSAHKVVPRLVAQKWIQCLLRENWSQNKNAAMAASMIARCSGDRERDLEDEVREQVITQLVESKSPASWITMVKEASALDASDQQRMFGEDLPAGLRILNE